MTRCESGDYERKTVVFGLFPPDQVAKMGLSLPIVVIGASELAIAVLLLIPRTYSLGLLLSSAFWGGAICLHMSKGEAFVPQSVLLLLTWVGAYLRVPKPSLQCMIFGA
jgi:hypothetical protein